MKTRPFGSQLFHQDGKRQDEAPSRFTQRFEQPNKQLDSCSCHEGKQGQQTYSYTIPNLGTRQRSEVNLTLRTLYPRK